MPDYRRNHYVPQWYQRRLFPEGTSEQKLFLLDLKPDEVVSNGRRHTRKAVLRWGPVRCFSQDDL